jgi:hypothetical protein
MATTISGPYVPTLIDDGTLDTVIQVKGPTLTREYRFDSTMLDEKYEDYIYWAMRDAIDQHRDIEFYYIERKMEIEEGFYDEDDMFDINTDQLYSPERA